jgi:transcriptional regulator with XRE-family HTH domain
MKLTKNQKLRITRIGQGLTLEEAAKKVFLSTSYVSLMETDKRKVPDFVENILNFDEGIRWYETIVTVLSNFEYVSISEAEEAEKALQTLNRLLRV